MTLTGVKRSKSGWAVERQLSSGSGGWEPGSAMPDPGQWAASGREAGLRVLWGGEEGGLAHTHWESGKKLQPNKSERLETKSQSNILQLISRLYIWSGLCSIRSFLSVACSCKNTEEQRLQTDGHADRLPPGGDHHAVTGPSQHHPTLRCGAHTAPEDGEIFCCLVMFEHESSLQQLEWPFFSPPGDRAGPPGFTVRHPALASVRVPSAPPLALCYTNRVRYGLPRDPQIDPQGPGCQKRATGIQGDGEDWGLWLDERTEPRDGPLCHVSTQKDPVCMVRAVGKTQTWRRKYNREISLTAVYLLLPGVPQRAFASARSPTRQMCGCLVSPCGRCLLTVRSRGSVCQADRWALISCTWAVTPRSQCLSPSVCMFVSTLGMWPHPDALCFQDMPCDLWVLISITFSLLNPDLVACGTRGGTSGATTGLPPRTVHCHEEVLGLQSVWQAELCSAHHIDSRGAVMKSEDRQ